MNRSQMKPGTSQLKRTPMRAAKAPMNRAGTKTVQDRQQAPAKKSTLKTKQRAVTFADKRYWSQLAALGCIACLADGRFNSHVSIHHVAGRTAPGCHSLTLPLCSGHHQCGTGEDKTLIAVHPWKSQFEQRYGTQEELMARCRFLIFGATREAA